jgi:hypothetical protein
MENITEELTNCTLVIDTLDKRKQFSTRKTFSGENTFCCIRKKLDHFHVVAGDITRKEVFVSSDLVGKIAILI